MAKAQSATVSSSPLFEWFKLDKGNRAKLRAAGFTDGRITNWKARGIPRAEVGAVAQVMTLNYDEYLVAAGEKVKARPKIGPADLSEDALEIARAFDHMEPQTQERARELVFMLSVIDKSFPWLRTGRPVAHSYGTFEKWHEENMRTQLALEAVRIAKTKA